jgi:hypothetical protein
MLHTYLRPFERSCSVASPFSRLRARLWNELMLEAGKDSVQSGDNDKCSKGSGYEASARGSSPRRSKCVTVPSETLHDVLESS